MMTRLDIATVQSRDLQRRRITDAEHYRLCRLARKHRRGTAGCA